MAVRTGLGSNDSVVLALNVQHVQEHVPVAEDQRIVEARHTGVVDAEQEERNDLADNPAAMTRQCEACLGQPELTKSKSATTHGNPMPDKICTNRRKWEMLDE